MDPSPLPPTPGGGSSRFGGLIRRFFRLNDTAGLVRRTYRWTTLAGSIYCGSSLVFLVLTVRLLGDRGHYWGGVLSLAMAASQQLVTIGQFQMRTYQVSDIERRFSFGEYLVSRGVTVALMAVAGLGWLLVAKPGHDKAVALLLLLALKAGESFSDVFEGRYQQCGRLDIASKGVFYKTLLPMVLFVAVLGTTHDLLAALAAMTGLYWVLLLLVDGFLVRSFARLDSRVAMRRLGHLLSSCLPLCINAFLFIYINNLSKYVIDGLLDERSLTEYNALFMLSFLFSLLSGFTLRPALVELSRSYVRGSRRAFCRQLGRQLAWVAVFAVPGMLGSYWLGVRVLTLFYGIDLMPYRNSLCVLMGGGALLAVYHVFQSALIIMRHQTACLVGISGVALAGWFATPLAVRQDGMPGGATAFFLVALLLSVVFATLTAWFVRTDFHTSDGTTGGGTGHAE